MMMMEVCCVNDVLRCITTIKTQKRRGTPRQRFVLDVENVIKREGGNNAMLHQLQKRGH